jgi:methylated-DNA-[protein]-cysteine S-methyltransferase
MDLIFFDTPYGRMGLAEEGGTIVRLYLPNEDAPRATERETPILTEGKRQLAEYFAGARRAFDLPLHAEGTAFRQKTWRALTDIPYSATITYAQLAAQVGNPKAVRAVGQANHHNPIPILIPCHRVVGADGSLTGYGGGVELKKQLLDLEQEHG